MQERYRMQTASETPSSQSLTTQFIDVMDVISRPDLRGALNLTSNEVLSDEHMACHDEVSTLLEAKEECCESQDTAVDYDRVLEQEIIQSMRAKAATVYYIDPNFLTSVQRGLIQWHMRLMLFDWMMEVSDEFALSRETFHLSITYVDLYLTRRRC